jgi:hypothetical protein
MREEPSLRFACPCCHFLTLSERGGFEICPVCFWEDDGQDDEDAVEVLGGPNGELSLDQARKNYLELGACARRFKSKVRAPQQEEIPLL